MSVNRFVGRVTAVLGGAAAAIALGAAPASAHVGTSPSEAPAGSRQVIEFRIGHGCDGSPTTKLSIKIPEGVVAVTPQYIPGWTATVTTGPITPYDDHGTKVTEGVTQVEWSGGPLPDEQYLTFGLSLMLPDTEGETVSFPAVQTCEQGETAWIEQAAEGGAEPEHPAPAVKLTAAAGDDHGGGSDGHDDATSTSGSDGGSAGESASAAEVEDAKDSASSAKTFGIIGMSLGAAGLALAAGSYAGRKKGGDEAGSAS
jgi:uncharacterized protein YcnI